jgi:hypothetical protein
MGENPLLQWLQWKAFLPHRWLYFLNSRMWRRKRLPTCHARRVQPKRIQWIWLLQRQHCVWLQSPNECCASSWKRYWWLLDDGLYGALEQNLSIGAKSDEWGRLHRVQKCLHTIF